MKLRLINRKYIIKTNVKKKWTKYICLRFSGLNQIVLKTCAVQIPK